MTCVCGHAKKEHEKRKGDCYDYDGDATKEQVIWCICTTFRSNVMGKRRLRVHCVPR